MINISVVSGTYNRIRLLQQMVDSVRRSVGKGLGYEIILVDGGSTDGTIEWCKKQPDVVLIEQGKLLGAVKAFNAGCFAARGKYVILANDDVSFRYDSIMRAYAYMEDNLGCGIGCFYQDRGKRDWYVDRMSAVTEDGEKTGVYYGQVCIVPRDIGNEIGWWGDYLHTYGADNEMSCNIVELGYTIDPIECACIHDSMVNDDLRHVNNQHILTGTTHPDSIAFRKKWPLGPTIPTTEMIRWNPDKKLRLLYAPIYEQGQPLQLRTKMGLLQALRKKYDVCEINYLAKTSIYGSPLNGIDDLYYAAQAFKPDIFLLQVHDAYSININLINTLRMEHPKAIFFSWNGDYIPKNLNDPNYHQLLSLFHVATFCTADIAPLYRSKNINWQYWQIGYEEYKEIPLGEERYDVIFQGNEYSEKRTYLGHLLSQLPCSVGIYGHWQSIRADGTNIYNFAEQDRLYRSSKITISDQQHPQSIGYVSNRLLQAMRSGVFVLQQRIPEMEKYLGMENGVHLVVWDTIQEIPDLVNYYLKHEDERVRIASTGKELVIKEHSFGKRVDEFDKLISGFLSKNRSE